MIWVTMKEPKDHRQHAFTNKYTWIPVFLVTETSMKWTEKTVQRSKIIGDPARTMELQFFDKARLIFNLDDLLRASTELMGKGELESTYKTMPESGLVVAVNKLKETDGLSKKKLINQMQLHGNMRHDTFGEILSSQSMSMSKE